jgi:hypothetical protein
MTTLSNMDRVLRHRDFVLIGFPLSIAFLVSQWWIMALCILSTSLYCIIMYYDWPAEPEKTLNLIPQKSSRPEKSRGNKRR